MFLKRFQFYILFVIDSILIIDAILLASNNPFLAISSLIAGTTLLITLVGSRVFESPKDFQKVDSLLNRIHFERKRKIREVEESL